MSTSNPPPSSRFAPFYTILNAAPKETCLGISPLFGSLPNYEKLYKACRIERGALIGILLEIGLVRYRQNSCFFAPPSLAPLQIINFHRKEFKAKQFENIFLSFVRTYVKIQKY